MAGEIDITEHLDQANKMARVEMRKLGVYSQEAFDDVEQDARIGLLDAAQKYDPDTGVPFPAYAAIRIKGAIIDGFRTRGWWSRDAVKKGIAAPRYVDEIENYDEFLPGFTIPSFEDDTIERLERERKINWLVGHGDLLTAHQREVMNLMLAHNETSRALAARLGCTESNVAQCFRKIRVRLKPLLKNNCENCKSSYHNSDRVYREASRVCA